MPGFFRRATQLSVGLLTVWIATGLISGCAKSLQVQLVSAAQLNPSVQAMALPVVVKLYQLRDAQLFNQASFRDLWQQDRVVLGNTLLAQQSVTLLPDHQKIIHMPRHSQAQYIAAIALFRQPEGQQWRVIQPITGRLQLTLVNNQLAVQR
ncbi:MAG: type VI secretion system lipoprotein TssJ [Legionellales bacterium]|nr:type VI secretion system lipoprotein TssJ [Legionellales bacterium]